MTPSVEIICPKRRLRRATAEVFGIDETALLGRSRLAGPVRARYAFAYVARRWWPGISYPRLGAMLGGRDHSTIIHGLRQFGEWLARDPDLQAKVARLLASRLSDQHDAHVRCWADVQAEAAREAALMQRLSVQATVRHEKFEDAVALGVALVSAGRNVRPCNELVDDDHDALRRKAGSDALGRALAAAGGWR